MTDIEKAFFPPEQVDSLMRGAKECTRGMCGTPEYVAPEIYRKEHYSYPADVWSVGVILYRMLVGGVSTSFLFDTSYLPLLFPSSHHGILTFTSTNIRWVRSSRTNLSRSTSMFAKLSSSTPKPRTSSFL